MNKLSDILPEDDEIKSLLQKNEVRYLSSQILDGNINGFDDITKRVKLVYLLLNGLYSNKIESDSKIKIFENEIYVLLKTINVTRQEDLNFFDELIGIEALNPKTLYYFYLSSVALKSDRTINIRPDLKLFETSDNSFDFKWKSKVLNKSLDAFILLVRKKLFTIVPRLESIASILEENLKFLESNSIWTRTKFNDKIQQLCRNKSEAGYSKQF